MTDWWRTSSTPNLIAICMQIARENAEMQRARDLRRRGLAGLGLAVEHLMPSPDDEDGRPVAGASPIGRPTSRDFDHRPSSQNVAPEITSRTK